MKEAERKELRPNETRREEGERKVMGRARVTHFPSPSFHPTPSVTLRLGSSALRLSSPFLSVPEGSLAPSFVSLSGLAVRSSVPARFPSPRSSVRHSPRHSPPPSPVPPARKRPVGPATHPHPWPLGAPLTRPFGRPAPEPGPVTLLSHYVRHHE